MTGRVTHISVPGHFGEWIQGRIGAQGPVALITLPVADHVRLWHVPQRRGLRLHGVGLRPVEVRRFLRSLGLDLRGVVRMRAQTPLGLGTGVSTARLVGLARLAGWQGSPEALAAACIESEGAADPLAFPAPERMLWASRIGRPLEHFPPLPRYEILGGFWGGPSFTDPQDTNFADISDLVAQWSLACGLEEFAALATQSALRCTDRRGPKTDPTPQLVRDLGALGWLRAHTGAARGLIFAPGTVPDDAAGLLRAADLRQLRQFRGGER
ncbi:hypothetical protein [Thioclava pacifica]|uniref:GHMP kinase N-terminal domain-containing protein n=1 Tax=Thioclava pacifica DSM 10166 TaxID=1353537 RepID=A0A074JGY5_9RHOB|nr:hypothetical protein [Thioclava pacifica]KEO54843.1 hypothetical protein TP2_17155 [Thioclava pacifica DSM 10166]